MLLLKKISLDEISELKVLKDPELNVVLSVIEFRHTYTKELLEILKKLLFEKVGIEFTIVEINGKYSLAHVLTVKSDEFSDKDLMPLITELGNRLSNCKLVDLINEAKKLLQEQRRSRKKRR